MLSDEVIERVVERLVNRIEQGNEYILQTIGENIAKFRDVTPSQAQELYQIIRYGGDYDKIVNKLSEITKLNVKDIYEIFHEVAKNDYLFAEQFYKYRNIKYIPYEENIFLKEQVNALAKITANEYVNLTKTLAFAERKNGKVIYTDIAKKYQEMLDEAVLNVGQGKETFDSAMYRSIKKMGSSGIRTVNYTKDDKTRSMRVDSAVRMQMKSALANLHEEVSTQFGNEYKADGKEISVHLNPAPDHAEVQGHQFKKKEFEKFQNDQDCKDVNNVLFPATFDGRDRRSIGQYNCYHYTFNIIVGVSEPEYTPEQLQEIINNNNKGFEFEGEHYTMYEGTQLQRRLELEIRKQKDLQIVAKASKNEDLKSDIKNAQDNITRLTKKYKELSEASGLPTMVERMRVANFKRTNVKRTKQPVFKKYDNNEVEFIKNNKNVVLKNRNLIIDEWTSDGGGYHGNTGIMHYMNEERDLYKISMWEKGIQDINAQIKGKLNEDITVYRTIQVPVNELKIGDIVDEKGFIATSITRDKTHNAFNYGDARSSTIDVDVKKETRALYIGDKTGLRKNEHELLFPPEYEIKITNIKQGFDIDGKYKRTLIKGKMIKKG